MTRRDILLFVESSGLIDFIKGCGFADFIFDPGTRPATLLPVNRVPVGVLSLAKNLTNNARQISTHHSPIYLQSDFNYHFIAL